MPKKSIENGFILDPEILQKLGYTAAAITELQETLNSVLSQVTPEQKFSTSRFLVTLLEERVDLRDTNDLLIQPEVQRVHKLVESGIAFCLFELLKMSLPQLNDPFSYTANEAAEICKLYKELTAREFHMYRRHHGSAAKFINPFDAIVSKKHLSHILGVTSDQIKALDKQEFNIGALRVRVDIDEPRSSVVKRAHHESVDGDSDRRRFQSDKVDGNIKRLVEDAQHIRIRPSLA